ncbi:MAG TPA: hypothetical protein VLY63_14205 [Anaerolineae bacterium]|nr:hypothetical protein [Anaerolineae bacterium]
MHLKDWNLDVLIAAAKHEAADKCDAVLAAKEGEIRSARAAYPMDCLGLLLRVLPSPDLLEAQRSMKRVHRAG